MPGQRQGVEVERAQLRDRRVAGGVQRRPRTGEVSFRRERSGGGLAGQPLQLGKVRTRQVVIEIRGDVGGEGDRPAAGAVERRAVELELRDRQGRIAERRGDGGLVGQQIAHARRTERQRAVDLVVLQRCGSRQQVSNRRRHRAGAGE